MRFCSLIAVLAGGASVLAQSPAAKPENAAKAAALAVEQAVALRSITDLRFSPDGRRLAFTVSRAPKDSTREQEIWMLNVQSRRSWRFAHSHKSSRNPSWSPNGCNWPSYQIARNVHRFISSPLMAARRKR